MAWAERGRMPDGAGGGRFSQITPVVKWLLILNIGIFLLDTFIKDGDPHGPLRRWGTFLIQDAVFGGRFWEFISFQFIHGNLGHVLLNSIAIFIFGPFMERWWGSWKFLLFYLLSGIGGAAFFTLLVYLGVVPNAFIMGASAGVYGILVGVAVIAPSLMVTLLFPPISLKMRTLALVALGFAVASILFGIGRNQGGEAGHLGGAIVGFILMQAALRWGNRTSSGGAGFGKSGSRSRGPRKDIEPKIRPRTRIDLRSQTAIDAILDKISKDGFQSLTQEERDLLHRAASNEQQEP